MKNSGFISIDDIINTYLPLGFSNFKIEGRGLGSAVNLEFLLYYLTKAEYQLIEYDLAEVQDTFDDSFLDDVLGITRLGLSYPTHTEGIEGECFNYSVYFTDDNAGEEKAATVRNVVESFDFGLKDDDYAGYLSISADKDKVSIYLDLGNVQPGNENKVIHGILLALNNVQGIKSVIINEK